MAERLEVPQVLDVDRPVEAVLALDLSTASGVARSPSSASAGSPEGPIQTKSEDREPEEDRDEQEQPADDEPEQLARGSRPPTAASALPNRTIEGFSRTTRSSTGLGTKPRTFFANASAAFVWTYGTPRTFLMISSGSPVLRSCAFADPAAQWPCSAWRGTLPECVVETELIRGEEASMKVDGSPKSPVQPRRKTAPPCPPIDPGSPGATGRCSASP